MTDATHAAQPTANSAKLDIFDTLMSNIDMDTVKSIFKNAPKNSPVLNKFLESGKDLYKHQFKDDMRPFWLFVVIFSLVFIIFVFHPMIFLFKLGSFCFCSYSAHKVIANSEFVKDDSSRTLSNVLTGILAVYLFKVMFF
eukprot:TRINITY_DN2810_c0_g1_i1.p1 TRINITY_DN2810_c0_g1~~TRINITY_DN2810_c0_g1_i1.p1  ORF type:complete len:152 (-),score=13.09 TRINITY_DN2810_c0_g1_i1:112-531(-)